jgi:small subunit ribosomal protein S6
MEVRELSDYEGVFITKTNLTEEGNQKLLALIEGEITKNGGKVENTAAWGKKSLAYPVNKSKEGIYYKLDFKLEPDKVSVIRKAYRLNEDILRSAIVKKGS